MTNLQGILLLILISFKATTNTYGAALRPIRHSLTNVRSVYGSSSDGGCTSLENNMICSLQDGSTSVLVDGIIPPLSGLDGNQWARDLFTVNKTGRTYSVIGFDFGDFVSVRRLELVLFNCNQFQTVSRAINVYGTPSTVNFPLTRDQIISETTPSPVFIAGSVSLNSVYDSCDNLLRVCLPISFQTQVYYVEFYSPSSSWVVLAEATFYTESTPCSVITSPITPEPSPVTYTEPSTPVDNTDHPTTFTTPSMPMESTTFTTPTMSVESTTFTTPTMSVESTSFTTPTMSVESTTFTTPTMSVESTTFTTPTMSVESTTFTTPTMSVESTTFTTTDTNVKDQTTDTTNTTDQNTDTFDSTDVIITSSSHTTHTAIAWTLVTVLATLLTGSLIVNIILYKRGLHNKNSGTTYHMDDNACYGQTQMKHITTDTDTPHVYDTVGNMGI